jgi:hypothetical protein
MAPDSHFCPTFCPTKEQFSKPFCDYVAAIFKKQPGLAMFKVKPPRGWVARAKPFPNLSKVDISCPIKQMAFGTKGAYRCLLIEQKALNAADFKAIAEDDDHRPQSNNTRGEVRGRCCCSRCCCCYCWLAPFGAPRRGAVSRVAGCCYGSPLGGSRRNPQRRSPP